MAFEEINIHVSSIIDYVVAAAVAVAASGNTNPSITHSTHSTHIIAACMHALSNKRMY